MFLISPGRLKKEADERGLEFLIFKSSVGEAKTICSC